MSVALDGEQVAVIQLVGEALGPGASASAHPEPTTPGSAAVKPRCCELVGSGRGAAFAHCRADAAPYP